MPETNWVPIEGEYLEDKTDGEVLFRGRMNSDDLEESTIGLYISNHTFSEGMIDVVVEFTCISAHSCVEIVLGYDPSLKNTALRAGIPDNPNSLFAITEEGGCLIKTDNRAALRAEKPYHLSVHVIGSVIKFEVNGVVVLSSELSRPLTKNQQVGLYCSNAGDIKIRDFNVNSKLPQAFVVMQLSSPFNEVYSEVIKNVCESNKASVFRVDENFGPGIIIADINQAILESTFVIADITPTANANVFYEVGYAHALKKPVILLAQMETKNKLPFDVSPFRILFYENTISGKHHLEDNLRKAIAAILENQQVSVG
jgi:hypothetical protein